jgi:hypothetical protein
MRIAHCRGDGPTRPGIGIKAFATFHLAVSNLLWDQSEDSHAGAGSVRGAADTSNSVRTTLPPALGPVHRRTDFDRSIVPGTAWPDQIGLRLDGINFVPRQIPCASSE